MNLEAEQKLAARIRMMYESTDRVERQNTDFIRVNHEAFFAQAADKIEATIERLNEALQPDGIVTAFNRGGTTIKIITCARFDASASLELKSDSSVAFFLRLPGKADHTDVWKFDTEPGPCLVLGQPRAANAKVRFADPEEVCDFVIERVFGE